MEFWGIEVKAGETVKCEPGDDKYLHLSQASLGEVKKEKGNESIPIHLKFDNKQLVIGTLSVDKCPQITYDLVFEKEFELSHSWKNGSVFFVGYKTEVPDDGPDESDGFIEDFSDSEEETPVKEANGKPISKDELAKTKANVSLAAKPSVKAEELKKVKKEDEDDSDEDEDDSDEDESDDEDMLDGEDDSSDEDDDESSEEKEDTPKKAEIGKKRAVDSALKTPAAGKKAKLSIPAGGKKTGSNDGKKGGHTATPHPAKQGGKTPATNDKSKQQSPKSAGSVPCKSCSKTFKDDNALQAHSKAKHASK